MTRCMVLLFNTIMIKKFAVILVLSLILLFLPSIPTPALSNDPPAGNPSITISYISPYPPQSDVFQTPTNPSPTRTHPYSIIGMKDRLFDGINGFLGKIYAFLKYASENYLP